MSAPATTVAKPFLKWAGGKRQLLPQLRPFYPAEFRSYFEPFVGSGAVFFDLHACGMLAGHEVVLSDSSFDLIACYTAVRDRVDEVIAELERLELGHRAAPEQHYYEVRDRRFNPLRHDDGLPADERKRVALAAMVIYLNRTGYNGLFRVNARGDFNVPLGRYERPRICDGPGLRLASAALRDARAQLHMARFTEPLATAREGDFVYLDPPYAPVTPTARFTSYTARGFDSSDQHLLREAVIDLAHRGVHVLLSNSAADEVKALYADDPRVRGAGLRAHRVPARRAINSRATARGPVEEYIITNGGLLN